MSDNNNFDPYEAIHKLSLLWEKQINDFIYLWTNNNEFVKISNLGTELHSRSLEAFKKNQEALAGVMNMPTKNDVANVAALTVQAEEKIEALEEQIWELQDSVKLQTKDIESVVEASKEIIKLTKQLKTELVKTKKELADTKSLKNELQEIKIQLLNLTEFKDEFIAFKDYMKKDKPEELELTGAGSGK